VTCGDLPLQRKLRPSRVFVHLFGIPERASPDLGSYLAKVVAHFERLCTWQQLLQSGAAVPFKPFMNGFWLSEKQSERRWSP